MIAQVEIPKDLVTARQEISDFLTANILLIRIMALDMDWSRNTFTLHHFCSIKQVINLRKVRDTIIQTWNLEHILKIK